MPKNEKTAIIAVTYGASPWVRRALEKEAARVRGKYEAKEMPSTLDGEYFAEVAQEIDDICKTLDDFYYKRG
jgi:hypothetical protein